MNACSEHAYAIRTAIDQRGEQTLNKDAKTAGGLRGFAANQASVLKWTLNRREQANNTKELLGMCGLNASLQHYTNSPIRRFGYPNSNGFTE